MSQAGRFTPEVTPGTYIEQINGDIGEVHGAIVDFNALNITGSTWSFSGGGTIMILNSTDINNNIVTGGSAGNPALTGSDNTAMGFSSFSSGTTASANVLIGTNTGALISVGDDNVALGHFAMGLAVDPSRSIAIGSNALLQSTGSYNIAVGYHAGDNYTAAESSNILLNNEGTATESNTLRIGSGTGTGNGQLNKAFISGIEGITVATADQVLIINSSDQVASIAAGTSGYLLTSGGPGANPTWEPDDSIKIITGDIGSVAGATIHLLANPTSGATVNFSGALTTMILEVTDNNFNTIVGQSSGSASITGTDNTGFGSHVMTALTSGAQNVAVGEAALQNLNTGSNNVAVGYGALGLNVSASNNVAVGTFALEVLTSGVRNIGIGFSPLVQLQTGTSNIAIGWETGDTLLSGDQNIYIGNIDAAITTESNTTRIGHTSFTDACYILGISGVDVGSVATVVTELGDQLGTATITAGINVTVTPTANTITIAANTGSIVYNYTGITSASSPYTALATDYYIGADSTSGVITVRLPNAPTTGRVFVIKDKAGTAITNNITVTTVGGSVNIDGAATFVMNSAYESIALIFNGSTYEVY